MKRPWYSVYNLPFTIGAALLAIQWGYLGWNTTVGEVFPAARFRTKATIAGAVQDASDTLSVHSLLTGKWQRAISREIGVLSPLFKPALRWKNQIYYSVLGTAGSGRVVIGRKSELLEKTYLDEYCARDIDKIRAQSEVWAPQIRTVQDFFTGRGQAFLYVITPSKVAQNPQYIPDSYHCPAPAPQRDEKLKVFTAALRANGVNFIDTASGLAAAKEKYGIDMFPRGGIHWNWLAAALGTKQFVDAVNAEKLSPPLTDFDFTWTVSYNPTNTERDLLDILNLPAPDRHFPVPEMTYVSKPPPGPCRPVKITEVGGSFMMGINSTLEKLACPPDISYWFYWDHNRFRYANDHMRELPMDADVRTTSLLDADLVVYEENEAAGPMAAHGPAFMDWVKALTEKAAQENAQEKK